MREQFGDSTDGAVARMTAAAPTAGVTVHRLSSIELILEHDGDRAGVVLDESARRYHLTEVPEALTEKFGPGGPAYGMGRPIDAAPGPGVLLAGRSRSSSITATREPATGRWELTASDPLSAFAYQQLTEHGWHRVISLRAAVILMLVPAGMVLAFIALVVAVGILAAPWAAAGVVVAGAVYVFGLVLQGPRTPEQGLRRRVDGALFWVSILGPFFGTYLIRVAFERAAFPVSVLGVLVILMSAALQFFRR